MSSNNDEVQSIQRQIHEKKTSILDSTRRMLGLINESEAIGNATATVRQKKTKQMFSIKTNDFRLGIS